jgi:sigma-E factor negative regulatory protein RseC
MQQMTARIRTIHNQNAFFQIDHSIGCTRCVQLDSCAANSNFVKEASLKHTDYFLQNTLNAKKGDHILLEISRKNVQKAAFIVYIAPILGLFLSLSLFHSLLSYFTWDLPNEAIWEIFFGFFGLFFGFLYTNVYNQKHQNNEQYKMRMVKIIH